MIGPEPAPADALGRELLEGPAAVEATLRLLTAGRAPIDRLVGSAARVVLVGTGASLVVAHAALPVWRARLGVHGREVVVRQSTEAGPGGGIGDDGLAFRSNDLVFTISQSGASPETLAAARAAVDAGATVVAVTSHQASPLASLGRATVQVASGEEHDASTKSAVATLAALLAIADAMPPAAEVGMRLAAELRSPEPTPAAAALAAAPRTWFLGFGPGLGLAEAAALLWHEKVHRPAVATTPSEFRHGAIESAATGDGVVLIDVERADTLRAAYLGRLRDELAAMTIAPIEVGDVTRKGASDAESGLEAVRALLALQRLARATALAAGTYRDGFSVLRAVVRAADDLFA